MIFGKSRLTKALQKWSNVGGALSQQLAKIGEPSVNSRAEAVAVGEALKALRRNPLLVPPIEITTCLNTLANLILYASSARARRKLAAVALPELRLFVQDLLNGQDIEVADVSLIVFVLASYGQPEDANWIVTFALSSYAEQGHYWDLTFERFYRDPERAQQLIDVFAGRLPTGFAAVAYLDMANMLALSGHAMQHPFDHPAGQQRLEQWLRDRDSEVYSYAHSATAALPFIKQEARQELLLLAREHPDVSVRMEAAWATIQCGDHSAVELLQECCLDPRTSTSAQGYLQELGYGARISSRTQEPEFQALEMMSNWLAHPREFACLPDTLELFDTRELFWPPTNDRRRLWLVKYGYQKVFGYSASGIGLVGTILSPINVPEDSSPEETYALYCCWELERFGDKRAPAERTVAAGRALLAEQNPEFF